MPWIKATVYFRVPPPPGGAAAGDPAPEEALDLCGEALENAFWVADTDTRAWAGEASWVREEEVPEEARAQAGMGDDLLDQSSS